MSESKLLHDAWGDMKDAAATYSFSYDIDSFGSMIPSGPSVGMVMSREPGGQNRLQTEGGQLYWPNGNVLRTSLPLGGGLGYTWTAEGYLRDIGIYRANRSSVVSYLYNGLGERVFAEHNSAARDQYVYLNGEVMADLRFEDKNSPAPGSWQNYIYANGQKIAKVASIAGPMIHVSGTNPSGGIECGTLSQQLSYPVAAGRHAVLEGVQGHRGWLVGLLHRRHEHGVAVRRQQRPVEPEQPRLPMAEPALYVPTEPMGKRLRATRVQKDVD